MDGTVGDFIRQSFYPRANHIDVLPHRKDLRPGTLRKGRLFVSSRRKRIEWQQGVRSLGWRHDEADGERADERIHAQSDARFTSGWETRSLH